MIDELKIKKSLIRVRFREAVQSLPHSQLASVNVLFLSESEKAAKERIFRLFEGMSKASKQIQNGIKGNLSEISPKLVKNWSKIGQKVVKNWSKMRLYTIGIEEKHIKISEDVNRMFDTMVSEAEKRRKDMLGEANRIKDGKIGKLNEQFGKIRKMECEIGDAVKQYKASMTSGMSDEKRGDILFCALKCIEKSIQSEATLTIETAQSSKH